jgi:TonB family protein
VYRRIIISIALLAPVVINSTMVTADSWALPQNKKYYSSNKKFCFEVVPKRLESQLKYFEDKVAGRLNAGVPRGQKDNQPKGIFYVQVGKDYSKLTEFPLINEVSPTSALVSNDGKYVVTFDNWHSVGYGPDVVVIYRADGTLVKQFGLSDLFTERDIEKFSRSVSSIWWGGDHHIDDEGVLHLKAKAQDHIRELTIDLATGRLLESQRELFAGVGVSFEVAVGMPQPSAKPNPRDAECTTPDLSFESPEAVRVSTEDLYANLKEHPLPAHPPIAKATRVHGQVVVEIVVSKTGNVLCARSLSGHPLLSRAAVHAALQWKFGPIETGAFERAVGTIAIDFALKELSPLYGSSSVQL